MIADNLKKIQDSIPLGVRLVAVSKTKPASDVLEAYNAGQRVFGENKPQEMCQKHEILPSDIQWHMIGHLQTNKVKYIAPFVALIHSIDSLQLLLTVEKEAAKNNRTIPILLQFHIASEETKFGLSLDEAFPILDEYTAGRFPHVQIVGVMGMATNTDNEQLISTEFAHLHQIFDTLKQRYFPNEPSFCERSMGMSGDFPLAIAQGSTLVRVGSAIFGARNYNI